MECEQHKGMGAIILSNGTEWCYGCYSEQWEYCPICGYKWDHPKECKNGEENREEEENNENTN